MPPARVLEWDVDIKVDVDGRETNATAWDKWVGDRIVRRIPGSGASGKTEKGGK